MIADNTTEFAPAGRAPIQAIRRQRQAVRCLEPLGRVLDAMPHVCLVLNHQRQVVCANRATLDFLGIDDERAIEGRRPGEALACANAERGPDGCGTSAFCRFCGAVSAVLECQRRAQRVERECRIVVERPDGPAALDVHVVAAPLELDGEDLAVVSLTDLSHQKRRRALERVFFHDIMNTVGSVHGLLELIRRTPDDAELLDEAEQCAARMIEEIGAQRDLMRAENGELAVRPGEIDSLVLLLQLARTAAKTAAGRRVEVVVAPTAESVEFVSDERLVRRVLTNMIKNAVEATLGGGAVTVDCRPDGDRVAFTVHNPGGMSEDVRMQVFQRSFSTKGENRGLGTYSMRLLSERYLRGEVTFRTDPDAGTTFTACYPLMLAPAVTS